MYKSFDLCGVIMPRSNTPVINCSEFVFDPAKWPRAQINEDFLKLSTMFKAVRSVFRVPVLDPKYKIAVLASKQVFIQLNSQRLHIDYSYALNCC